MDEHSAELIVDALMSHKDVEYIIKPSAFTLMCGTNKSASDVLARIYFWMRPTLVRDKGKVRLVYKYKPSNVYKFNDGRPCLVKSLEQMSKETQVGVFYSISRIYEFLEKEGYITTEVHRCKGHPSTHILLNWEFFLKKFLEAQNKIQDLYCKPRFFLLEKDGKYSLEQEKPKIPPVKLRIKREGSK